MRSEFGKKIVLLIHWLMSLALGISMIVLFFMGALPVKPQGAAAIVFAIAALIVYLIFAAGALLISFPTFWRWQERNFVTISSGGLGRTRIAVPALDQMIRKAVRGIEGIADMKTVIVNGDDAVEINVNIVLAAGAHVPTVTSEAQRAVRSYIEKNCGIEVSAVVVSVFSVQDEAEKNTAKTPRVPAEPQPSAQIDPGVAKTSDPIRREPDAWDELTSDDADDTEVTEEPFDAETSDEVTAGDEAPEAPAQGLSRSAKKRRRRKKKLAKLNAQNEAGSDDDEQSQEASEVASENNGEAAQAEEADAPAEESFEAAEDNSDAFDALDEPAEEEAPAQESEDSFTEYEESAEPEPDYAPEEPYEDEYPADDEETQKYDDYLND